MPACIICLDNLSEKTIEHIVPRSLGNIHYILPKGLVCKNCNQRFSRYEHAVLNSRLWLQERQKFGLMKNARHTDMATCRDMDYARFLLKILYESIYKSRRHLMKEFNFENIRNELCGIGKLNYILYRNKGLSEKKIIPGWFDAWRLKRNGIQLNYIIRKETFYFEMIYGAIVDVVSIK